MELVYKKNSKLMKVIAWLLKLFNSNFMEDYVTVIGETIYLPSNWDSYSKKKQVVLLTHEQTHIEQYKRNKLWFVISYLFLPLPMFLSYYRCKYEIEAYKINIEQGMSIDVAINELYGPKYLYAGKWFGKKKLRKWIEDELNKWNN